MKTGDATGFYCLANDGVLEWMIALLESLRVHEPERQLIVIPFDENITKLVALSNKYQFQFFEDASLLQKLDRIGSCFSNEHFRFPNEHFHVHVFRKFAAFWGPFEHFLFLDSDIVLLSNLEELFNAYFEHNCEFMANDPDMEQVYEPGPFRESMIADYSAQAFNAGCFLSSRNTFTLSEIEDIRRNAERLKEVFSLVGGEQPFLNYCVHSKRLTYQTFADVIDDLSLWTWAKQEPIRMLDGAYRLMIPGNSEYGKRMPYIHWAGIPCNPAMPNRKIFLFYRLKNYSWLSRVGYVCGSLYKWWNDEWKPRFSRKLSKLGSDYLGIPKERVG